MKLSTSLHNNELTSLALPNGHQLEFELATVIDAGYPFVVFTYFCEKDFCVFDVYDYVEAVNTARVRRVWPRVDTLIEKLAAVQLSMGGATASQISIHARKEKKDARIL